MPNITPDLIWLGIGFLGQAIFFWRFIDQWWRSERAGQSIIPPGFWVWSIAGALIILVYAIHRHDPVFIAGQGVALVIYGRNIVLIRKAERAGA